MSDISITLETSHRDKFVLNGCRNGEWNSPLMFVTSETFQSWIGPCLMSEQWPFGDILRHSVTAVMSSFVERGENGATERLRA